MQQSVIRATKVWLPEHAVRSMTTEANGRAPQETGGVLLGYWSKDGREAVVTDVVGPGPEATHGNANFAPDYDFQEREISRLYEESARRLHYLGDWHSHPNGLGELSRLDRRTLRIVGDSRAARAEHPVMVILAGGPDWSLHAWQYGWLGCWWLRWPTTCRLIAKVFEAEA